MYWVATRLPYASRLHWRKNKLASLKQQLLDPMKAAMLGCIEGTKVKTQTIFPHGKAEDVEIVDYHD